MLPPEKLRFRSLGRAFSILRGIFIKVVNFLHFKIQDSQLHLPCFETTFVLYAVVKAAFKRFSYVRVRT
jgi:hypothetical protein